MQLKDIEVGSFTMTDSSTGEIYCFGKVENLMQEIKSSKPSFDAKSIIKPDRMRSLAINNAAINQEQIQKIYELAPADGMVFKGYMEIQILDQKRKHKKRRINKKWLKRYGKVIRYRKLYATKITYKPEDSFSDGLHNFEVEFDEKSLEVLREYSRYNAS